MKIGILRKSGIAVSTGLLALTLGVTGPVSLYAEGKEKKEELPKEQLAAVPKKEKDSKKKGKKEKEAKLPYGVPYRISEEQLLFVRGGEKVPEKAEALGEFPGVKMDKERVLTIEPEEKTDAEIRRALEKLGVVVPAEWTCVKPKEEEKKEEPAPEEAAKEESGGEEAAAEEAPEETAEEAAAKEAEEKAAEEDAAKEAEEKKAAEEAAAKEAEEKAAEEAAAKEAEEKKAAEEAAAKEAEEKKAAEEAAAKEAEEKKAAEEAAAKKAEKNGGEEKADRTRTEAAEKKETEKETEPEKVPEAEEKAENEAEPEASPEEESTAPDEDKTPEAISEEEAAPAETAFFAGILEAKAGNFVIKAEIPEEALLPEGIELTASEIDASDGDYRAYWEQAEAAVREAEGGEVRLSAAYFLDICFVSEGAETEPAVPVSVKISCEAEPLALEEDGALKTVHFADNGPEILPAETVAAEDGVSEVSFEAEGFSVYGLCGTESVRTAAVGDMILRVPSRFAGLFSQETETEEEAEENEEAETPEETQTVTITANSAAGTSAEHPVIVEQDEEALPDGGAEIVDGSLTPEEMEAQAGTTNLVGNAGKRSGSATVKKTSSDSGSSGKSSSGESSSGSSKSSSGSSKKSSSGSSKSSSSSSSKKNSSGSSSSGSSKKSSSSRTTNPKTGDDQRPVLFGGLFALSCAALAGLMGTRKRKSGEEE